VAEKPLGSRAGLLCDHAHTLFDIPDDIRAAWPSGARDFDFLQGEWIIRHRRLRERLRGSNDWLEFETPCAMQAILGGLGNIDQCRISDGAFFEGVSVRLFDLADGLWRIYWIDTTGARLFPPVVGSFDGPDGVFRGEDSPEGRPVLVRFQWDRRYQPADRRQAFSAAASPGKPTGSCIFAGRMRHDVVLATLTERRGTGRVHINSSRYPWS
jgi:hypothetical protein